MASSFSLNSPGSCRQSEYPEYKKDFRTAFPQIIAVSVKNMLLLSYGMTLGFPTLLIAAVTDTTNNETLRLSISEISWIGSINLIVVPFGCALSGVITAPVGRLRAMQLVNGPFILAWLIFHFATTPGSLYAALVLTGLSGGLLEAPVLTYVAEITQPHLRGALSATSSMCIIIGVFTQFLMGLMLSWRIVALINIIFSVVAVIALCFIPESPHWLVSRKKYDEARKSLHWLRGCTNSKAVDNELKEIRELFSENKATPGEHDETLVQKLSHYTKRIFLRPLCLVSFAFFVGHFSGMTTLQLLDVPLNRYYATLILGISQIVGASVCVSLVPFIGKRPLAIISTTGAGICCLVVAGYDGYMRYAGLHETYQNSSNTTFNARLQNNIVLDNPYSWIPMTFLILLAFISHTGIRLLPWILIGEVFSANTRSGAAGLASAVGYVLGFLTNKVYLSMVDSLAIWGTYGFYGIICSMGCVVFFFVLPETEGKNLKDIENHFAGIVRLNNAVHRSTKSTSANGCGLKEGITNASFQRH